MSLESTLIKGATDVGKNIIQKISDFDDKLWKMADAPLAREMPAQALGQRGRQAMQGDFRSTSS